MRPLIALLACFSALNLTGCSLFQRVYNYQETQIKEYHDDWKSVGEEARGEMPRQKETDGLTPLLQSPEARAIEKNLGYD